MERQILLIAFLLFNAVINASGADLVSNKIGDIDTTGEELFEIDLLFIGAILQGPIAEITNQLKSVFNIDLQNIELMIDDRVISQIVSYFVNPDNVKRMIEDVVPGMDTEKLLVYIETGCRVLIEIDQRNIFIAVPEVKYLSLGCRLINARQDVEKILKLVGEFQKVAKYISENEGAYAETSSLLSSDTDNIAELIEDRHLDDPNYVLFEFPRITCDLLSGVQLDQKSAEQYASEIDLFQSACKVLTKNDVEILDLKFGETGDDQLRSGSKIFGSSLLTVVLIAICF